MELDGSERMYDVRREGSFRSDNEDSQWVALATHTHKERIAIENLERQGFSAYCPMMRKVVRHARKSQEVLRPFFPGYVFASFGSATSRWRSMASTTGVRRIIAFGEKPCMLSEDFISSLRAREFEGAITKPVSPYSLGQKVSLTGGAFEGLIATIIEMDEKQRLVVLLDLLSQSVRVRTDFKAVREI